MMCARFVCALAALTIACSAQAQLLTELRRITANAELGQGGIAGIAIRDAITGELIFEFNGDEPLAPASNQKLLTSAAAVIILGPEYAFTTELTPTESGDLVLKGSGDPAFGDPEVLSELTPPLTTDQALDQFTAAAAEHIDSIGQLIVDDRVFDRELIHPDWPTDQLERWYCAPVQGLSIHANVIAFYPAPAAGGVAAPTEPHTRFIEITDRAEVVKSGRNAVWIQRSDTDNAYTIRGSIKTRSQAPIEVALHEPALFAGRVVAERLSNAGATFAAPTPVDAVRLAEPDELLSLAPAPLARWVTPLDDVLFRCNHDSMNLHAETLLKSIGRSVTGERGTWSNGAAVLRMLIAETLGPAAVAGTTIRDGSGLSRDNRITASTMAAWLAAMHQNAEVRSMYLDTLPTEQGKLRRRFDLNGIQHRVYAKTGTISQVRCLSGYVVDESTGRTASFSILCNGLKSGQAVQSAYKLQADVIDAIDDNIDELALPSPEEAEQAG